MNDWDLSRNYLFVPNDLQQKIEQTTILLGGLGLGSVIVEAALRMGFCNFVLIDFDHVEASNLNRQNYRQTDIGDRKINALVQRLKAINPKVNLVQHHLKITSKEDFVFQPNPKHGNKVNLYNIDFAINALDYDTENNVPLLFDSMCLKHNIPIIHPINASFGAISLVIHQTHTPTGEAFIQQVIKTLQETSASVPALEFMTKYMTLEMQNSTVFNTHKADFIQQYETLIQKDLSNNYKQELLDINFNAFMDKVNQILPDNNVSIPFNSMHLIHFFTVKIIEQGHDITWLIEVLTQYIQRIIARPTHAPAPQLSIGAHLVAGQVVNIIYDMLEGRTVQYFPEHCYYTSIRN